MPMNTSNAVGDPGLPGLPVRLALEGAKRTLHRLGGENSLEGNRR